MSDLLKLSKQHLKNNLIYKAASFLDETADDLKESANFIIPLLFAAILHRNNKKYTAKIYDAISLYAPENISNVEIENLFSGDNGLLFDKNYEFLSLLFTNTNDIKQIISEYTNIHEESASAFIKMVLPLVLQVIYNEISSQKLTPKEYKVLLEEQKNIIEKNVSASFMNAMINDIGLYTLNSFSNSNTQKNSSNHKKAYHKDNAFIKLISGITLLTFLGIFSYKAVFSKKENNKKITIQQDTLKATTKNTISNIYTFYHPTKQAVNKYIKGYEYLGFFNQRVLKNNDTILVLSNGGLNNFLTYIEEGKPVNKEAWFDLNKILVNKKEATINIAKSSFEIENLLKILNAYPNINVKIGGLTDNEGPADVNFNNSYKIAESFVNLLIKKGISRRRLTFEGYGENYPIVSNEDLKHKNRNNRISIRLTKK